MTDCKLWTGPIDKHGYGRASGGRLAHRVIWETIVGPIPEGLTIDHLCRTSLCVNVEHLEVVTLQENLARRILPHPTHCKHGHEFTPENTRLRAYGEALTARVCRACDRRRHQEYVARRAAA